VNAGIFVNSQPLAAKEHNIENKGPTENKELKSGEVKAEDIDNEVE